MGDVYRDLFEGKELEKFAREYKKRESESIEKSTIRTDRMNAHILQPKFVTCFSFPKGEGFWQISTCI
jgi:hypothetical protein